jgi:ABC-type transport system involved in multi-copper enzyme maturation permease subunit
MLASREVRTAMRGRWFLMGSLLFGILAVAVSQLGMEGSHGWGISAADRTSAALLNLVLLFVPLLGIPLGASSFAGEREDGTLGYLTAQPVSRSEIFTGKLAGLISTITLTLALGFGLAAIWVGLRGAIGSETFWSMAFAAWLLGAFSVSLGVLFATITQSRLQALALSIGAWVVLVFLCDFGVLALAAGQLLGPSAIFAISIANPLQAVKTFVALFLSHRLEVLGPAGVHALQVLGSGGLLAILIGSIAVWIFAISQAGYFRFRKEDFA